MQCCFGVSKLKLKVYLVSHLTFGKLNLKVSSFTTNTNTNTKSLTLTKTKTKLNVLTLLLVLVIIDL